MSKSRALAGLRVGYAIGDADLIEALTRVKGQLQLLSAWAAAAQAGAIAALEDEAHFQQSRARVIEGRERLNRGLHRLGFDVLPSAANFVFARHPARDGTALTAALRERAVIVRHFGSTSHQRLSADHRGHGWSNRPAVVSLVGHTGQRA